MIREPKVFLFDEPLSNLDAKLRVQMRLEIRSLHRRLSATSVFVTHDQVEAMTLADRLVVMNGGRVEQVGTPAEVYRRPASRFVAGFIGAPAMNFIEARVIADGLAEIGPGPGEPQRLAIPGGIAPGCTVTLGIRPEEIEIGDAPAFGGLDFDVELDEELGSGQVLHGTSGEIELTVMRAMSATDTPWRPGQRLPLRIPPTAIHLFDAESGARIETSPTLLAAE